MLSLDFHYCCRYYCSERSNITVMLIFIFNIYFDFTTAIYLLYNAIFQIYIAIIVVIISVFVPLYVFHECELLCHISYMKSRKTLWIT